MQRVADWLKDDDDGEDKMEHKSSTSIVIKDIHGYLTGRDEHTNAGGIIFGLKWNSCRL